MALNSSGPLSFGGSTTGQSINLELGVSATALASINSTAFRTLAGVPSGAISVSNFYGKANFTYYMSVLTSDGSAQSSYGIAADSSGNRYMLGNKNGAPQDRFIVKFNGSGVPQWGTSLGNTNTTYGFWLDTNLNTYISGTKPSTGWGYVAKFNSSGTFQWERNLQNGNDVYSVAVDNAGNVYIAGSCFDGGMLVKFDSAGTVQWQRRVSTAAQTSVAVSGNGTYVYVAGSSNGGAYIAQYNSSGAKQWSRYFVNTGAAANCEPNALAVTDTGYVVMAAYSAKSITGVVNRSPVIFAFDSSGTNTWSTRFYTGNEGYPQGCTFDSSGNVYICVIFSAATAESYYIKINSSGTPQWQRKLTNSTGCQIGRHIKVQGDNFFVTGSNAYTMAFASFPNDGTKTGTYAWNVSTTYAAGTGTFASGYDGNIFANGGADAAGAYIPSTPSSTTASYTATNTVYTF